MTTSWLPGTPNVPVAVKPAPAAVRALIAREPAVLGAGRVVSSHDDPPSVEIAANGNRCPDAASAVPAAATVFPFAATYCKTARVAEPGRARVTCRQTFPFGETQAAGWVPDDPAAAKPPAIAVTAISWLSPPVSETTACRHPASPAEYQAIPAEWPPLTCHPTIA